MLDGWELGGLSGAAVATTFAVGAALVVLYLLLRPRPPVVHVGSHMLWDQILPKRRDPLRKELLMLLLQIVAIAALALALGEPRPVAGEDAVAELGDGVVLDRVWIVDRSLSMRATDPDGASRIERVAAQLREQLPDIDERVRVSVVGASATPELLAPIGADRQRVHLALRLLDGEGVGADLSGAVRLAASQPGLRTDVTLLEIYTDDRAGTERALRAADAVGLTAVVRAPFEARSNVAITAFELRASEGIPAEEEAVVRLANLGASPAEVLLRLETLDAILGEAVVDLEPGQEATRRYRFQPLAPGGVEAVLRAVSFDDGSHDALPDDDRAYAWVQPIRPVRVLLVSRGNRFLERVLALLPGAQLDKLSPSAWAERGASRAADYDVVFLDSVVPEGRQPARAFYVDPPPGGPFEVAGQLDRPAVTDWNHDHALFQGLVLRDLQVQSSSVFKLGPGDLRLVGSPSGALVVARETAQGKAIGWGFDFARSDLPLRLAFPQTIVNTLLWMRQGRAVEDAPGGRHRLADPLWVDAEPLPGARARQVAASGDEVDGLPGASLILTDLGRRDVALARGDDRAATRASSRLALGDGRSPLRFPSPGLWRLEGPTWERDLAVNLFESPESVLSALPLHDDARVAPPPPPPAEEPEPAHPAWVWLAVLVGALLLTEFGVYTR